MTNNEAHKILRDMAQDMELSGASLDVIRALNAGAAALLERDRLDWLSADTARQDIKRLSERLFDLTRVCDGIAATLESIPVPAGHYREQRSAALESLDTYLKGTAGLIGEIWHPSFGKDTL